MRIRDIILTEGYAEDLINAVRDLLTTMMAGNVKQLKTEHLRAQLAKAGFVTSMDELIQAVDHSGFASSVDRESITPVDSMAGAPEDDFGPDVDVGNMASNQAMKDIKSDLDI